MCPTILGSNVFKILTGDWGRLFYWAHFQVWPVGGGLMAETCVSCLFYLLPDSENMSAILVAHTDAVWDLAVQTGSLQLLSASADGTCKLWSPTLKSPLLNSYVPGQSEWCLYWSALTSFQLSLRKVS